MEQMPTDHGELRISRCTQAVCQIERGWMQQQGQCVVQNDQQRRKTKRVRGETVKREQHRRKHADSQSKDGGKMYEILISFSV